MLTLSLLTLQDMLFTDEDLQTMFGMFDIVRKGTITVDQYKQGVALLSRSLLLRKWCCWTVMLGEISDVAADCSNVDAGSRRSRRPGWGDCHL